LTGTIQFTYDEAFYLIGHMGARNRRGPCIVTFSVTRCPDTRRYRATTLDSPTAPNLVNIALPEGASANFASGTAYNVTAVPEPGEWAMLLAGLGLVGWRARRKRA